MMVNCFWCIDKIGKCLFDIYYENFVDVVFDLVVEYCY